jgi:hypothetical protein
MPLKGPDHAVLSLPRIVATHALRALARRSTVMPATVMT